MTHHHDTGYKELFSSPELVRQLMEGFAPSEICRLLDYATLKKHPGNYITPLFDEQIEDVVWSVQLKPEAATRAENTTKPARPVTVYLYILLEFQSSIDKTMPLRMLHYTASFYHQLLKEKKINLGKDKLPPVFPILLYSGKRSWKVTQEMQQLIHPVPTFLKPYQPSQRYYLLDEQRYSFEALEENAQPISGTFALEKSRSADEVLRSMTSLFRRALNHPDAERIVPLLSRWAQRHLHHHNIDINLEQIADLKELTAMLATKFDHITQEGIEKGIEKGIEQGKLEMARNLLLLGLLNDEQIAQASGLPLKQIQALRNKEQH